MSLKNTVSNEFVNAGDCSTPYIMISIPPINSKNQQIIKSMIEVPNANGTISITAYACRIDVRANKTNAIIHTYMQYQYTYLELNKMLKLRGKLDPDSKS